MILNTGQSLSAGTVLELELIDYMLTLTQDIYSLTYACILHRPDSFDLPRAGHVGTAVNYISPERPHT